MKPTLGRIVHYMEDENVYAGIVVHAYEDSCINLVFWTSTGTPRYAYQVRESKQVAKDDRCWFWPPVLMPTPEDMKKLRDRIATQMPRPSTEVKS